MWETRNEIKSRTPSSSSKSVFWAYFWWFFGGIVGTHHLYLERDDQALIWLCTLGGYFGIGWLRDLYRIPSYVAEANNDPQYVNRFKFEVRSETKPPFSVVRFLGAIVVSYLFGNLVYLAIPEDEIYGINFKQLIIFIPLGVAYGTWLVGNVGREKGSIWLPLIVAYLCYPTLTYIGDESTWICIMVIATTLAFDTFSKKWRFKRKQKRGPLYRLSAICIVVIIYGGLWSSYFYFNATLTDSEGEEIKLSEAIKHFLTSPIWLDLKASLEQMWIQAKHQGFWTTWRQLIDLTDPRGEINAYRVLGLSQTASQSEVTSKWRTLSREHHPDKVKGSEEERRKAQEKFLDIQQAYEILSSAKNRRQKKNKKSDVEL